MNSIEWVDGKIMLLDQTRLPSEQVILEIDDYHQMIEAIQSLRIRGAPALGVAAAYAIVLGAQSIEASNRSDFLYQLGTVSEEVVASRPTAVNMAWAARRMHRSIPAGADIPEIRQALIGEAALIMRQDVDINIEIGAKGAMLIPDHGTVLTHCNTGNLATAGFGTALGVLRAAREQGKDLEVVATETRPLLQGARLTAWELAQDGFKATLITDSMVGHFMKSGRIDCVILGADRIALNGDVANKIGTYTIAVVAHENKIPFYVAAPMSTIDPELKTGDGIPIEERSPDEVTGFQGLRTAPEGFTAANPAFDVTPHRYISAIVTEHGVATSPYTESLKIMLNDLTAR